MIKNQSELLNCADMLKGNICRLCVTDDKNELDMSMYNAITRIMNMYRYRHEELKGKLGE